jgi:hypothetical protein
MSIPSIWKGGMLFLLSSSINIQPPLLLQRVVSILHLSIVAQVTMFNQIKMDDKTFPLYVVANVVKKKGSSIPLFLLVVVVVVVVVVVSPEEQELELM